MSRFRIVHRALSTFAIPNVTTWLIAIQVLVYAALHTPAGQANGGVMAEQFYLFPDKVLAGEYWRLLAFLALPPMSNPICAFFFWYLLYLMGSALERFWGAYRYNVYLWIGWLATVAVAFFTRQEVQTNAFLQSSVFLAFAFLNPDFELCVFMILPIRIKWLALLTWITVAYFLVFGPLPLKWVALASVANFLLYFGPTLVERAGYGFRRMSREARRFGQREPAYYHKCTVCGITDRSHPGVEFRYCSQCAGRHCYCSDHVRSHEHVADDVPKSQAV